MKKFNIGDKVIVDNPFGSYHEKFRGMKGKIKYISNHDGVSNNIVFMETVILEFDTNPNMYFEFSINEVSLTE